ncbi:MAG: hypothetical protein NW237_06065 [Cyanobacteriota bacterium]|nr:hypothetical protein [Cyanobacteriota bacterium]
MNLLPNRPNPLSPSLVGKLLQTAYRQAVAQRIGSLHRYLLGGILVLSGGTMGLASAQEVPVELTGPLFGVEPAVEDRVNEELVSICGDYRCDDYRFQVRVPIQVGDTFEDLEARLTSAMLAQVDQAFQGDPGLERVVIDGRVYRGSETFVALEVPLLILVVPRHRWVVDRYGIEQDSFVSEELLPQVQALLVQPTPDPEEVPNGSESPLPELPPLPDPVSPSSEVPPSPQPADSPPPEAPPAEEPPPQGDTVERQPIQP